VGRMNKTKQKNVPGFEKLAVGRPNALAVAVAKEIVVGTAKRFTPLVIEGESGFGKTAILNAITEGIEAMKDGRKVMYVTGDGMLDDYVSAMKENTVAELCGRYAQADVLIIDQFEVACLYRSLGEFLRKIVCDRIRKRKQLVVATSIPLVSDMKCMLPEGLTGRLISGVVVRLSRPDKGMRMAMIKNELHESGLALPDSVVEAIAVAGTKDMWSVGSPLHRVMLARELMGRAALRPKRLQRLLAGG